MSGPAGSPRDALVVLAFWQAARIARLEAQVAQVERLTAANKDLADRVARLEYLLSRNSGNSSS
ncbi:hypothetical protein, partial [Frankia sp. KB5]|uniref:hypothetical protein n=1 Tax=Frankia sp. KB5 TaxID=683318 RepID=UPI000A25AC0F